MTIAAAGHRMAAGRTGTVQIQTGSNRVSWGRPAAVGDRRRTAGRDPTIFTIPAGAMLANGQPAAGCRLTFPLFNNAPTAFTTTDGRCSTRRRVGRGRMRRRRPAAAGRTGSSTSCCVSVDGLNPTAITMLGPSGAPTFYRLMAEGASTLNARTAVERTQTLPNHTSMATGRTVALPGGHGVTFNEDPGTTIHDSAGQYVASSSTWCTTAAAARRCTAGKDKFAFHDRSWAATTGAPDTTGPDNGRDKIDIVPQGVVESATTTTLVGELAGANRGDFTFIHYHDTDTAGHA